MRYFVLLALLLPISSTAGEKLRILTLNIFAGTSGMDFNRLERLTKGVRKIDPDIIAFQEAYDVRVKDHFRDGFSEYDSHDSGRATLPRTLPRRFIHMMKNILLFANRLFGVADWIHGTRAILDGDTHGLMILTRKEKGITLSQTKVVQQYNVQAATGLPWLLEQEKPRGFQSIEYVVGNVPVLIVNTHLSVGMRNPRRLGQLVELAKNIIARNSDGRSCPTIFCGDTNAHTTEPEMLWWHSEAGFRDTSPNAGNTWDNANPLTKGHLVEADQRVDYISVRRSINHDFKVVSSQVVFDEPPYVSDHYGILTEVEIIPACERQLADSSGARKQSK